MATVITNVLSAIPWIGKLFQFDISNNKINKVGKISIEKRVLCKNTFISKFAANY